MYRFFDTIAVEVKDKDDIEYFKRAKGFELITKVQEFKEKISRKENKFNYKQWLIDKFRNDVADMLWKIYPELEDLQKATYKDLIGLPGIGKTRCPKIFKEMKKLRDSKKEKEE